MPAAFSATSFAVSFASVGGGFLHIFSGIGDRIGVLAGVLGHLIGNALTGSLDLVAQLVALLVDGGGNVAGSLLDGSGHIGAAGSRLGGDLLAAGGHVVHHFGALGGSLLVDVLGAGRCRIAPLLGIADELVGLVGHHRARLHARTRRSQQSCDGTDDATDQKHSKFVGHDCLLYRRNIKFAHYRVRASRPQPLMRGSHLTVNKASNIIDK